MFVVTNNSAELVIDPFGGAIRSFRLKNGKVNPISFNFFKQDFGPDNVVEEYVNSVGWWDYLTDGEKKDAVLHGNSHQFLWDFSCEENEIDMKVRNEPDGFYQQKKIKLHARSPMVCVTNIIGNGSRIGRFYQQTQHPVFTPPFLERDTRMFCNASFGFNQIFSANLDRDSLHWPYAYNEEESIQRLNRLEEPRNSELSFIVEPKDEYGWVVVYSKKNQLMAGYIWPRECYPWIYICQRWYKRTPVYLSLKFSTTGLHHSFSQLVKESKTHIYGEPSFAFIDAGEEHQYKHHFFLHRWAKVITQVDYVKVEGGELRVGIDGKHCCIADQIFQD